MKLELNSEQKSLLLEIVCGFDPLGDITDEEYFEIDATVSDYLATHGLTKNGDEVNDAGRICESILDILSEY